MRAYTGNKKKTKKICFMNILVTRYGQKDWSLLRKIQGRVDNELNEKANLVEIIELPNLKHFIASQFHPEFKSRPLRPAPLFDAFIKASINNK